MTCGADAVPCHLRDEDGAQPSTCHAEQTTASSMARLRRGDRNSRCQVLSAFKMASTEATSCLIRKAFGKSAKNCMGDRVC